MDPFTTQKLGRTVLKLPRLGFGGAGLGDLFVTVDEAEATGTLETAWTEGIRYFDTSPWYGRGQSEHRLGRALYRRSRDQFILSTKVGRLFREPVSMVHFEQQRGTYGWSGGLAFEHIYDYSYDGIMRSYEDSQQRLGFSRIDMLLIHDLDVSNHSSQARVDAHLVQLTTGGFRALEELRQAGRIGAIGAGVNDLGTILPFLDRFDLDFFLVALRYTLAEQAVLDAEFPACAARGVGIVIGGVFNSGILATGPREGARYNYAPATTEQIARVGRIEAVCTSFDVPLPVAALQFPLHHPLVASVIPGSIRPAEVTRNVESMRQDVPEDLWQALKSEGLIRADAPVPGDTP